MELIVATLLGAICGWAANQFLPGLWRLVSRQPTIHLFVETDPAIIWAGAPPWIGVSLVVPDVTNLGSPPTNFCPDWYGWLRSRGAVFGDVTEVELTLTAAADVAVVLDGIRAKVVRRATPPKWAHLLCAVGGADITPRHMKIDLGAFDPPTTSFVDESGQHNKMPKLSLSKNEVEKFHIMAESRTEDVEWTAELLAIVNGKRKIFTIDDNGRPFRTCGTEGLATHTWYGTEWDPPLNS